MKQAVYDARTLILVNKLDLCLLKAQLAIAQATWVWCDCAFLLPLTLGEEGLDIVLRE